MRCLYYCRLLHGLGRVCDDERAVAVTLGCGPLPTAAMDFGRSERAVRINSLSSGVAEADLEAVLRGPVLPDAIVIPKVDSAADLHHIVPMVPPPPPPPTTHTRLPPVHPAPLHAA